MRKTIYVADKILKVFSIFYCLVVTILLLTDHLMLDNKTFIFLSLLVVADNVLYSVLKDKISEKDSEYRKYLVNKIEKHENLLSIENENQKIGLEKTEEVKEEAEPIEKEPVDILYQMLKNNDETTEYFKISKRQAQSSFWFSIIACVIGIVAILLSIYAVFEIGNIQFAIISIIGGAITELIAGTVLVIHNKSALQLNYYYDALHENEKFLSAVNLADTLENDKKEGMYIEIIKAQVSSSCKREQA